MGIAERKSGSPAKRYIGIAEISKQETTEKTGRIERGNANRSSAFTVTSKVTLNRSRIDKLMEYYRMEEPYAIDRYFDQNEDSNLLDGLSELGRRIPEYFSGSRADLEVRVSPEDDENRLCVNIRSELPIKDHVESLLNIIRDVYQPIAKTINKSIVIL